MGRRTKEEILEDEEFTCKNGRCKKKLEIAYSFSLYHQQAKADGIDGLEFCEECFRELEGKI